MLAVFKDIAKNAPFPDGVMKGNSYEVIGDKMGGDADDYMLSTFGIPSVTAEMGFFGQYIEDWRCSSKAICYEILRENTRWIEYIFKNLTRISEHVISPDEVKKEAKKVKSGEKTKEGGEEKSTTKQSKEDSTEKKETKK
jgi:hypothetical protein